MLEDRKGPRLQTHPAPFSTRSGQKVIFDRFIGQNLPQEINRLGELAFADRFFRFLKGSDVLPRSGNKDGIARRIFALLYARELNLCPQAITGNQARYEPNANTNTNAKSHEFPILSSDVVRSKPSRLTTQTST